MKKAILKMQIRDWKKEMTALVDDFQFHEKLGDIEHLKEMVSKAEKLAEVARTLVEEV